MKRLLSFLEASPEAAIIAISVLIVLACVLASLLGLGGWSLPVFGLRRLESVR